MTKSINLFLLVLLTALTLQSHSASAQAPQAIPYQAVARDNSGATLANQNISLQLSIHDATATGTIVYQETHTATTSSLGLFNVNIGQGTPITGTLASVDWGNGSKFIQIEFDPTGGTSYTDMGTTQLMSVPYALSSGDNQWTKSGNNIFNNNTGNIGIGTSTPAAKLHITGGNVVFDGAVQRFYGLGAPAWDISGDQTNFVINRSGSDYPISILKSNGNVGINNLNPVAKLDVNGTIKISGGSPAAGKVLTSDANGLASWATIPTGGLGAGSAAGNTPYWNGTSWVTNSNNIFNNGGNVGIGITSPTTKLHVSGEIRTEQEGNSISLAGSSNATTGVGIVFSKQAVNAYWYGHLGVKSGMFSLSSLTPDLFQVDLQNSGALLKRGLVTQRVSLTGNLADIANNNDAPWYGIGFSNITLPNQSFQAVQVSGYWGLNFTDRGGNMVFSNGKLGIGTNNPSNDYLLTVAGKVICTELRVQATPFPDYVFDDKYELKSLEEVEAYIKEHKHLPNMPKATEVEANAMNVGEIELKLVEKVEELTLHLIQQQKEINELKSQLGNQKK